MCGRMGWYRGVRVGVVQGHGQQDALVSPFTMSCLCCVV